MKLPNTLPSPWNPHHHCEWTAISPKKIVCVIAWIVYFMRFIFILQSFFVPKKASPHTHTHKSIFKGQPSNECLCDWIHSHLIDHIKVSADACKRFMFWICFIFGFLFLFLCHHITLVECVNVYWNSAWVVADVQERKNAEWSTEKWMRTQITSMHSSFFILLSYVSIDIKVISIGCRSRIGWDGL